LTTKNSPHQVLGRSLRAFLLTRLWLLKCGVLAAEVVVVVPATVVVEGVDLLLKTSWQAVLAPLKP
jgi:hypothetical protein